MSLTSKIALTVTADLSKTLDLATARAALSKAYQTTFASGTAAGQADKVFHDQRTLGPSATENLDLAGSLTDALGDALTFAKIKGIVFSASAANSNNVLIGGDVTNTFFPMFGLETDSLVLRPGATVALWCGSADATGYAVTAGTADLLKVANSGAGTSVTYDVILLGTSA
jgi:hypothetical protein